jgi:hypothetical protein
MVKLMQGGKTIAVSDTVQCEVRGATSLSESI